MVVSGSVLGPEPAGWPVKDLKVNKDAQARFKEEEDIHAYVTSNKPVKIELDVWNPFDTKGVLLTDGMESLFSVDREQRERALREIGIFLPPDLPPGNEDVYVSNEVIKRGVQSGNLQDYVKQIKDGKIDLNKPVQPSPPTQQQQRQTRSAPATVSVQPAPVSSTTNATVADVTPYLPLADLRDDTGVEESKSVEPTYGRPYAAIVPFTAPNEVAVSGGGLQIAMSNEPGAFTGPPRTNPLQFDTSNTSGNPKGRQNNKKIVLSNAIKKYLASQRVANRARVLTSRRQASVSDRAMALVLHSGNQTQTTPRSNRNSRSSNALSTRMQTVNRDTSRTTTGQFRTRSNNRSMWGRRNAMEIEPPGPSATLGRELVPRNMTTTTVDQRDFQLNELKKILNMLFAGVGKKRANEDTIREYNEILLEAMQSSPGFTTWVSKIVQRKLPTNMTPSSKRVLNWIADQAAINRNWNTILRTLPPRRLFALGYDGRNRRLLT